MKYLAISCLFLLLLFSAACTPSPPTEAEVRAFIKGSYCTAEYKLVITDSTYTNTFSTPSPLRTGNYTESCSGSYELNLEGDTWKIIFAQDDNPQTHLNQNCGRTDVVWTPDALYLIGNPQDTIADLFGRAYLTKSSCK